MVDSPEKENRWDMQESRLQALLEQVARKVDYPPTPDIAARERRRVAQVFAGAGGRPARRGARTLGVGLALVLVLLLAGLLVSPVRARLLEFLRIGAVQIFLEQNAGEMKATPPGALTNLAGETTLAGAAEQLPFQLVLPTYPAELGEPDRVYAQEINQTPLAILVWLDPDAPEGMRMALYQIGQGGDVFQKRLLRDVQQTFVNGEWALWVQGPYLLSTVDGAVEERRLITGRTLIWEKAGLTYRLETNLPLEEARKIAESVEAWQGP